MTRPSSHHASHELLDHHGAGHNFRLAVCACFLPDLRAKGGLCRRFSRRARSLDAAELTCPANSRASPALRGMSFSQSKDSCGGGSLCI